MRVISERIIDKLEYYMSNRPETKDTLLEVLSIGSYPGYESLSRDYIIIEAGLLKYKLYDTTLFSYNYDTKEGYITTGGNHSKTTTSRVKDLLDLLFFDVYSRNGKLFVCGVAFEYNKVFHFRRENDGFLYIPE